MDKGGERERERERERDKEREITNRAGRKGKKKKEERSIDNQLPPHSSCNQSSGEQKVTTGWKIFRLSPGSRSKMNTAKKIDR